MTSTFASARENVSDEQLKDVTGGARVNSRPHGAEDHLNGPEEADLMPAPPQPPPGAPVVT